MRSLFKIIDAFGSPMRLNVGEDSMYTSAVGGVFTLSMIAVVLVVNYQNIDSFVRKDKVIYTSQTAHEVDPTEITMDPSNFMMAITIDQPNFDTTPYFSISVEQLEYLRYDDGVQTKMVTPLVMTPCNYDQFQRVFNLTSFNFSDTYEKLNLKTWLCPQFNNISLQGVYQSNSFKFVRIQVNKCNQSSYPSSGSYQPKCAPQEEVDQYLEKYGSFKLSIYTTNNIINPNKASNFIQQYFDDQVYFTFTPQKLSRQGNIYFRKFLINSDESLMPWVETKQQIAYSRKQEDIADLTELGRNTDDKFAVFYIRRSPLTEQIQRGHQKINDLLGQIGGFLQIMLLIFGIFMIFYNRTSMMLDIANKSLNFNYQGDLNDQTQKQLDELALLESHEPKRHTRQTSHLIGNATEDPNVQLIVHEDQQLEQQMDKQMKHQNHEDSEDVIKIIDKHQNYAIQLQAIDEKDYFAKQLNQIQTRQESLRMNYKTALNLLTFGQCYKDSKECIIMQKALKQVKRHVDIHTIMEKLDQIDKIKKMLFNSNQQIIFDFSHKPIISADKQKLQPTSQMMRQSLSRLKSLEGPNTIKVKQKIVRLKEFNYQLSKNLYNAYEYIIGNKKQSHSKTNKKLIQELGPEVQGLFLASKILEYDKNRTPKLLLRQNGTYS